MLRTVRRQTCLPVTRFSRSSTLKLLRRRMQPGFTCREGRQEERGQGLQWCQLGSKFWWEWWNMCQWHDGVAWARCACALLRFEAAGVRQQVRMARAMHRGGGHGV